MIGFTALALLALAAAGAGATSPNAQQDSTWDVVPESEELDVEKRYTPELVEELQLAKDTIMLLFTDFTAKAGADLKMFIRNISRLAGDAETHVSWGLLDSAPTSCRTQFNSRLKKIEYDAHRSATFTAENHHKFFKGPMIVFRMHLNKSEEYIKKCVKLVRTCGIACETTPKVARWRRLAKQELNRVLTDIPASKRSYHDLVIHAHRKLNKLRKDVDIKVNAAIEQLEQCASGANAT